MFAQEESNIKENLVEDLKTRYRIKWQQAVGIQFNKINLKGEIVSIKSTFRSENMVTTNDSHFDEQLAEAFQQIFIGQE